MFRGISGSYTCFRAAMTLFSISILCRSIRVSFCKINHFNGDFRHLTETGFVLERDSWYFHAQKTKNHDRRDQTIVSLQKRQSAGWCMRRPGRLPENRSCTDPRGVSRAVFRRRNGVAGLYPGLDHHSGRTLDKRTGGQADKGLLRKVKKLQKTNDKSQINPNIQLPTSNIRHPPSPSPIPYLTSRIVYHASRIRHPVTSLQTSAEIPARRVSFV